MFCAIRANIIFVGDNQLTDAQRADHHARREAILAPSDEVRVRGGDRSSGQFVHLKSYADQAAQSLGVDPRTVRRDLRRGKSIAPEVLAEVAGTELDKGAELPSPTERRPARPKALGWTYSGHPQKSHHGPRLSHGEPAKTSAGRSTGS